MLILGKLIIQSSRPSDNLDRSSAARKTVARSSLLSTAFGRRSLAVLCALSHEAHCLASNAIRRSNERLIEVDVLAGDALSGMPQQTGNGAIGKAHIASERRKRVAQGMRQLPLPFRVSASVDLHFQ